jgi:hypothetical protein
MKQVSKIAMVAGATLIGALASWADTLQTHRIPAALAVEAASETVAACARQGYRETAAVLDPDGATIVTLRGDGAATPAGPADSSSGSPCRPPKSSGQAKAST